MNMQAYNPKEEQALPSDYEQLLNHTVHQLRHKINVCGQKKMLAFTINLCICLQKLATTK